MDAGAGIVRLDVEWPVIAAGPTKPLDPTNPGSASYDFSSLDFAVTAAEAHRLKVLLSINHAPPWAEGPNSPLLRSDRNLAAEPTRRGRLRTGRCLPLLRQLHGPPGRPGDRGLGRAQQRRLAQPPIHRQELHRRRPLPRHAERGLRVDQSVNPKVQVVVGGTDPYGDPPGGPYPSSGARSRPVQFWQHVFCVKPVKTKKKKGSKKPATTKYTRTAGLQRHRQLRRLRRSPDRQHRQRAPPVRPQPIRRLHPRPRAGGERPPRRREGGHSRQDQASGSG